MSIIGPRPEKTEIVKKLDIENPYYELRHLVRPGITGWAQVNNPIATPSQNFEKLEYDLFYIKNANLFLEIKIILKTIIIILKRNSL
jgi:lipopolysaccharide/colanic/teichoic acid biosynthesis glycosyltransferase